MKANKVTLLAVLAAGSLLAGAPALRAGDTNAPSATPTASPRPRGGLERMMEQLDLTADQKPKVQSIMEAHRQKMMDLRQDTTLSPEDRRAKMRAIREDMNAQLKATLTPEQFEKWQKMMPMGRGPRNRPPGLKEATGTNAPAATPQN